MENTKCPTCGSDSVMVMYKNCLGCFECFTSWKIMNRKSIIVLVAPGVEPETWGNFKKMCESKGFPYHSLKVKKFTIQYLEFTIYKVLFN